MFHPHKLKKDLIKALAFKFFKSHIICLLFHRKIDDNTENNIFSPHHTQGLALKIDNLKSPIS